MGVCQQTGAEVATRGAPNLSLGPCAAPGFVCFTYSRRKLSHTILLDFKGIMSLVGSLAAGEDKGRDAGGQWGGCSWWPRRDHHYTTTSSGRQFSLGHVYPPSSRRGLGVPGVQDTEETPAVALHQRRRGSTACRSPPQHYARRGPAGSWSTRVGCTLPAVGGAAKPFRLKCIKVTRESRRV